MMFSALMLLLAYQNCAPQMEGSLGSTSAEEAHKAIDDLSSQPTALSCQESVDCQVVPVGQRPCGGPSRYVIASTRSEGFAQIVSLAGQITKQEDELNRRENRVGTCEFHIPPEVACIASRCVAQPSSRP
jgi:hypothetical protein